MNIKKPVKVAKFYDYRGFLRAELKKRKVLSPKYSLRDFAKSIGTSPSFLSYLLRNKRGLSKRRGWKISNALALKGLIRLHFLFLISERSGRSKIERNLARQALSQKPHRDTHLLFKSLNRKIPTWGEQVMILSKKHPKHEQQLFWQRLLSCKLDAEGYSATRQSCRN